MLAPAFGTQKGPWEWRSFTAGDNAQKTVIMVRAQVGYQYLITLDWFDYDGREDVGRKDAEDMAKFICAAVNQYAAIPAANS